MRDIAWTEYGRTVLSPLVVLMTAALVVCVLLFERRRALTPVIAGGLFITQLQRVVIAGLDLDIIRLLIVALWIRILLRGEHKSFRLNSLDKAVGLWAIVSTVAYVALWKTGGALMYRLGWAFDAVAAYAAVRVLVRGTDDIRVIAKALLVLAVPVVVFMVAEYRTHKNLFASMGGVPAFNVIREGRVRAQGAFAHPILAGTWGASLLPCAWALAKEPRVKSDVLIAVGGAVAGLLIVVFSASSGPLLSLVAGLFAIACWRIRFDLLPIKAMALSGIVLLSFVMKDPVWALLAKVTVVGGSTGYHRFFLVDQAIRRLGEWWLVGIKSTAHWGWGLEDLTNMYVKVGVEGGMVSLLIFIWVLREGFRSAGVSTRAEYGMFGDVYAWMLGSMMFVHVVSFLGVAYFGQMIFFFFLALGQIGALTPQSEPVRDNHRTVEVSV